MKSKVFFIISLAAMLISLILLSFREDGERIAVADDSGKAVLAIDPDMQASYFVCLPESRISEVPEKIDIGRGGDVHNEEILGPRPLDLPNRFAKKFEVEPRQQCAVSEILAVGNDSATESEISAPEGALVVAAVSSNHFILVYLGLFLAFVVGLWGTFCINSKKEWTFRPAFRWFDFIIVFVLAMLTAYAIAMAVTAITPNSDLLFPSYAELLGLMVCNFVGFLVAAGAWAWFRNRKARLAADSVTDNAGQENALPEQVTAAAGAHAFTPWISIGIGIGLAVTAAVTVSFAPLPGLSTIEMASQLPSTCFMSGFFAILAGISEECLFRGVIQTSLEARPDSRHPVLQNAIAIGVATLLFTSLHVEQSLDHLWALIPITCVSLVSGLLKIRYKSLYPSMLLHMTYNATLLLPSLLIYTQFVM